MDLEFAKKMLEDKGLLISSRNLSLSWKKTRSHNFKYESFSHYMLKAGLVCLINKKSESGNKQGACSEYMFPSGRKADVLQFITKGREMVGYEVQTTVDKKKKYPEEVPMLVIDLTKAPEKVHEALKTLEDYLKEFIV
jgi:hypothetical protein